MQYHIVNAFSKNGKGGNPAAVFINQALSADEKQTIARSIGFSETAFLNQEGDRLHIEFFTPEKPIAYCGHATIASVNLLRQQQLITNGKYLLYTREQPITVSIENDNVYMEQSYPLFTGANVATAATLLNNTEEFIKEVTIARNGVGFLLVELPHKELLYQLKPNLALISNYSAKDELIGVYVFSQSHGRIVSRMFAPYYGINEENATGMAAGLLGGWLHSRFSGNLSEMQIEQGYSPVMKEKGYLHIVIPEADQQKILVGGEAVVVNTASVTLS